MDPIRIRVARIFDFGKMVSVLGVDLETDKIVVVHIDHRPLEAILDSWKSQEFAQHRSFEAENLTLNMNMHPDEDGDGGERLMSTANAA